MKKFIALFFFAVIFLNKNAGAQQIHFLYIQSDNQQQFSVTVNNKTYNSSSIGYVIISKLTDGQYDLTITFPDNIYPSQTFTCAINKSDAGYQLKNFSDKGWGLFNLKTLDVVMAGHAEQLPVQPVQDSSEKTAPAASSNSFGDVLSSVVNDSTLTKPSTVNNVGQAAIAAATVSSAGTPSGTGIIKLSQQGSSAGSNLVFLDKGDTINITIPQNENTSSSEKNAADENIAASKSSSVNNNPASPDTTNKPVGNPFYSGKDSTNSSNAANGMNVINSNCTKMASDDDLARLRKKLISESDPDKMTLLVKKNLRGKCLSTDQVRNLGILFVSDESRYNFFSAMYNSVNDVANYPSLENQLIDSYYKRRFQAMLR